MEEVTTFRDLGEVVEGAVAENIRFSFSVALYHPETNRRGQATRDIFKLTGGGVVGAMVVDNQIYATLELQDGLQTVYVSDVEKKYLNQKPYPFCLNKKS